MSRAFNKYSWALYAALNRKPYMLAGLGTLTEDFDMLSGMLLAGHA